MSVFLALIIAGLTGLICMALPGLARHGSATPGTHSMSPAGHGVAHAGGAHAPVAHHGGSGLRVSAKGVVNAKGATQEAAVNPIWWGRLIPSPRVIFSMLALIGAFGYAFDSLHLATWLSGLLALIPASLVERFMITPLWNFLFRFQGVPCTPLEEMVLQEAEAVTPFRNGRGLVSVVHDGRLVQFRAEVTGEQASVPVSVGDKLQIESVDAENERVTVSIHP